MAVAALVGAATVVAWMVGGPAEEEQAAPPPAALTVAAEIGGTWSLTDHNGRRVNDADFHGRYALVFFGYSSCPDVCPTALAGMAAALDLLGPAASEITPLFVTVDPARDTSEKLKSYVPAFHPRLLGLTGSDAEVAAAARAFRVYYKRADDNADYAMDHSMYVYLLGPDGKARIIFRPGAVPADMARLIRREFLGAKRV